METPCSHKAWRDGHCAEMDCWNYVNKCDKHRLHSNPEAECRHNSDSLTDDQAAAVTVFALASGV